MAKRRMTNYLRETATVALLHHATEAKATVYCQAERALADEVMDLWLGADKPLYEMTLKAHTPDRYWLNVDTNILVNAGGWNVQLNFYNRDEKGRYTATYGGRQTTYLSGVRDNVPLPYFIDRDRLNIGADMDLAIRIQAHAQAGKVLYEEARQLLGKITSTVASYTTVEVLLEDIPELATLEPKLVQPAEPVTAIVAPAKSLLCDIAAFRGEEREGCPCEASVELERVSLAA